jgi:hypothetical protein
MQISYIAYRGPFLPKVGVVTGLNMTRKLWFGDNTNHGQRNTYSKGGRYSAQWKKKDGEWKLQAELFVALEK